MKESVWPITEISEKSPEITRITDLTPTITEISEKSPEITRITDLTPPLRKHLL